MGKRSGVPHTDGEIDRLTVEELTAEIARARLRLSFSPSAKASKAWRKRIHWLETALLSRE